MDSERRIAEETAKSEGKPEAALPKIVEGRLNGFFRTSCCMTSLRWQTARSPSRRFDEAGVTVTRFVRFEVGQA